MALPAREGRAKAADGRARKGEDWGPLHGLPITIKDSFDLVGLPSTWGVPDSGIIGPATNALSVHRYIDAGAVAFGKTNVAAYLVRLGDPPTTSMGQPVIPGILFDRRVDHRRCRGGAGAGLTASKSVSTFGGGVAERCSLLRDLWSQAETQGHYQLEWVTS